MQHKGKKVARRIDLGLDIMRTIALPNMEYSGSEIAAFCGCSQQRIHQIEQTALKKLRMRAKELYNEYKTAETDGKKLQNIQEKIFQKQSFLYWIRTRRVS
jgi:hypothetical protein